MHVRRHDECLSVGAVQRPEVRIGQPTLRHRGWGDAENEREQGQEFSHDGVKDRGELMVRRTPSFAYEPI
jgi:hypothetical protein